MDYFSNNEVSFEEIEDEAALFQDKNLGNKKIRVDSKVSVASTAFGDENDSDDDDDDEVQKEDETEDKKKQGQGKRGKAAKWIIEAEFNSVEEFDDSPALQDLQDNYEMDNKMTSKDGNIVRTFVCKFSKKKKGFNCPVKARTVFSGYKMTIYRLDDTVHDHEASERKNFAFDKKAEEKMKELLLLNVSTRNIRKHLLDKGFYTKATFPSDQILYSKMSNLRKKLNLDRKKIGLKEFEEIIKQYSVEPEDST